jgi:superfamily II DNA/RNA helicase
MLFSATLDHAVDVLVHRFLDHPAEHAVDPPGAPAPIIHHLLTVTPADPPAEHKAYLHRSGRTGRAGASGVAVTLHTPAQAGDVRHLMRKARVVPLAATVKPGPALLRSIAGNPASRPHPSPTPRLRHKKPPPRQAWQPAAAQPPCPPDTEAGGGADPPGRHAANSAGCQCRVWR